ncbi:hypothetical protein AKO1_014374 [Acrasis kona]|uniref:EF-hand domain-containing protein n=1 Tax=Acrasis kona TaxID=1008807 RepID=A0AAW2YYY3_9EUKA
MQLQGQIKGHIPFFRSNLDCIAKTLRMEGFWALQKGLSSAMNREITKNALRFGMFDPILNTLHKFQGKSQGERRQIWERVMAGSATGVASAFASSPFELIRTRMQANVPGDAYITHEHGYTGLIDAIRTIINKEGWQALFRASGVSMARAAVGSGANLSTYSYLRENLQKEYGDKALIDALCGVFSCLVTVVVMNPIDVIRTRLFNQPRCKSNIDTHPDYTVYRSARQAFGQVIKNEGWSGLYKGFTAHFLRLGPQLILTFVLMEQFKKLSIHRQHNKRVRKAFNRFDTDKNSILDDKELLLLMKECIPNEYQLPAQVYNKLIDEAVRDILKEAEFIDYHYFKHVIVKQISTVVADKQIEAAFHVHDFNQESVINMNETINALMLLSGLSRQTVTQNVNVHQSKKINMDQFKSLAKQFTFKTSMSDANLLNL